MEKEIKKIKWNGEMFDLPCPIYVDLDELKKFSIYRTGDAALFLFMKSVTEWIKRQNRMEKEYDDG